MRTTKLPRVTASCYPVHTGPWIHMHSTTPLATIQSLGKLGSGPVSVAVGLLLASRREQCFEKGLRKTWLHLRQTWRCWFCRRPAPQPLFGDGDRGGLGRDIRRGYWDFRATTLERQPDVENSPVDVGTAAKDAVGPGFPSLGATVSSDVPTTHRRSGWLPARPLLSWGRCRPRRECYGGTGGGTWVEVGRTGKDLVPALAEEEDDEEALDID